MAGLVKEGPRVVDDRCRIEILELLVKGKTIVQAAELVGLHRSKVEAVAAMYGHPTVRRMEWSLDVLREAVAAASNPAAKPKKAAAQPKEAPRPTAAAPRAAAPAPGPAKPIPVALPVAEEPPPPAAAPPATPTPEPTTVPPIASRVPLLTEEALQALDKLDALVARGRLSEVARTREVAEQLIETAAVLLCRLWQEQRAQQPERAQEPVKPPVEAKPVVPRPGRSKALAEKASERAAHQRAVAERHSVTVLDIRAWARNQGLDGTSAPVMRRELLDAFEASRNSDGAA